MEVNYKKYFCIIDSRNVHSLWQVQGQVQHQSWLNEAMSWSLVFCWRKHSWFGKRLFKADHACSANSFRWADQMFYFCCFKQNKLTHRKVEVPILVDHVQHHRLLFLQPNRVTSHPSIEFLQRAAVQVYETIPLRKIELNSRSKPILQNL